MLCCNVASIHTASRMVTCTMYSSSVAARDAVSMVCYPNGDQSQIGTWFIQVLFNRFRHVLFIRKYGSASHKHLHHRYKHVSQRWHIDVLTLADMCTLIHTTDTHIHTYIYTCMHLYIRECMHTAIYTCVYTHAHILIIITIMIIIVSLSMDKNITDKYKRMPV